MKALRVEDHGIAVRDIEKPQPGVEAIVRVTARETAGRGVRVNGVAPGLLDGGMAARILDEARDQAVAAIPMGRLGTPDEFANLVVFLASERASYITGVSVAVDGGFVKGIH